MPTAWCEDSHHLWTGDQWAIAMGMKKTSEVVSIGFSTTESAANTFTEAEVDLTLDILNHEVFVILAVDLDLDAPDALPGTNTGTRAAVTTTSQTAMVGLEDANCFASGNQVIRAAGFADSGVGFTFSSNDSPQASMPWIAICATNNFFVGVAGQNCLNPQTIRGKLFGYRARADASTYAALVMSEQLSA